MPVHLRVDLPDRPGVLARLADGLARAGADVLAVSVVERSPGRAVDDFLLDWAPSRRPEDLTQAVEAVAGCQVTGLRRVATVPHENPALDLVTHVLWQPHRAVETLVDMLPAFAGADWAAAIDHLTGGFLYASGGAAAGLPALPTSTSRAMAFRADELVGVSVPVAAAGLSLVVARIGSPSFSRQEIDELGRLTELMVTLTRVALASSTSPASRLTVRVLPLTVEAASCMPMT